MLGIGDPVTEQSKVTSTPAAGRIMLDGTSKKMGGAGGTKRTRPLLIYQI